MRNAALGATRGEIEPRQKRGTIAGCDRPGSADASPTRIAFLASAPGKRFSGSSVSPACALSRWSDAQKNLTSAVRGTQLRNLG